MPRRATGYSLRGASFPVRTFKRALKMAKDVDRSLAKLRARIGRSLREEKEGSLGRLATSLPLTLPTIPAFVHSRGSLQLHVLQFRFLQSVSLTYWETRHSVSLPRPCCFFPSFLSLSLSSFFSLFSSVSFFSFSCCLFLCTLPPLAFRLRCFFCPSDHGYLRSSSLCLWFASTLLANRFPFFVKTSDTLIRCVVLFVYSCHCDYCLACSRYNYCYLRRSSTGEYDNIRGDA